MLLPKPKPPPFVPGQLSSIRLANVLYRRGIFFRKFNHFSIVVLLLFATSIALCIAAIYSHGTKAFSGLLIGGFVSFFVVAAWGVWAQHWFGKAHALLVRAVDEDMGGEVALTVLEWAAIHEKTFERYLDGYEDVNLQDMWV